MSRAPWIGLAIALLSCGASSGSHEKGAKSAGANAQPARKCGAHGLYALPASPEGDATPHPSVASAVGAFEAAESSFAKGDPAKAWREFLEAGRRLAEIPADHPLSDWSKIARELSYHNALWSAAAAGQLTETKGLLAKTAETDATLAAEIKAMLADSPVECAGQ